MRPAEVTELSAQGVDFQLHTHGHRVPGEKAAFLQEIEENRRAITEMTGNTPVALLSEQHLRGRISAWLAASGVVSAHRR